MKVRADIDPGNVLAREFTDIERRQLPFATLQAVNATAFATRQKWAEVMPRLFDRPTPLTLKAVLYKKATRQTLAADVFIRDEAFKGTPPAKYLLAQVQGGTRRTKGFERRLQSAGLLPVNMFAVPGQGARLDIYGNVPGKQLNAVLSQLGARFDSLQNETETSRDRRRKRNAKRGVRGGEYFAVKAQRGKLLPGIYERVATGFGSALRSVLVFVKAPSYRVRYDIFGLAKKTYDQLFPFHFDRELAKALQTAKIRGKA